MLCIREVALLNIGSEEWLGWLAVLRIFVANLGPLLRHFLPRKQQLSDNVLWDISLKYQKFKIEIKGNFCLKTELLEIFFRCWNFLTKNVPSWLNQLLNFLARFYHYLLKSIENWLKYSAVSYFTRFDTLCPSPQHIYLWYLRNKIYNVAHIVTKT